MTWTDDIVADIRSQIESLPHGQRNSTVQRISEQFGCSPATVRRRISTGHKTCTRTPDIPDSVIRKLAKLKADSELMGAHGRELAMEDAITIMEEMGEIEPGAVSTSTAYRRLRKMGWNAPRVYSRHEDDFVNQVHMMDFSRSEYFEVVDFVDGEHILKVDGRRGQWQYKNKPKEERLRLWVVGYIDTFSRAALYRYFASTGENLMMVSQFLSFAWERKDSEHPMQHLPLETLKLDQGAIGKNSTFRTRLKDHLGIGIDLAAPKNDRHAHNQSMGKVERPFRTLWQRFELNHAKRMELKGINTITLSDLNSLVHVYATARLSRKHPHRKESIGHVYTSGLRMKEQRKLKTEIFALLYTENTRMVTATADVQIDNELFKVPEKYVMQKVRFYTTPDGELRGSSMDRKDTFDLVPFDAAQETGTRRHSLTQKEELTAEEHTFNVHQLSITGGQENKSAAEDLNGASNNGKNPKIHHLPAAEKDVEADTPFSAKSQPIKAFTEWHECKRYICTTMNSRWKDLAEPTQGIFEELFETGKLTREVIDDIAQTAS